MALNNIDWEAALHDGCALAEHSLNLSLTIDRDIVREIAAEAEKTLAGLQMTSSPNVAKIAGHVAFWIRKLKPIAHAADSPHRFLAVNELVGILVGMGICRSYFDDTRKETVELPKRVMNDWIASLRHHSHSPHSCALMFELLASEE